MCESARVIFSVVYLCLVRCRSVKASHVLISADGQVCMSGLRSIFSLIRHGQRAKVVHDFPQYSVKVLPWLSPEVLQQVRHRAHAQATDLKVPYCEKFPSPLFSTDEPVFLSC